MLRVGVTGGIGSGKSTVCRILQVLEVPVFYADAEAKDLYNDPDVLDQVVATFGKSMVKKGKLVRNALADVVFNDDIALHKLNKIIHPAVRKRFDGWTQEQSSEYVVQEAAILVETGGYLEFDHLVVVACPEEERIRRIIARDGMSRSEVLARIKNQASEDVRLGYANTVIDNSGEQLVIPQVLALHGRLTAC